MRRVQLPSGKIIDVRRHLEICPDCRSHNVTPVTWDECGNDYWDMVLRCPDCDTFQTLCAVPQSDCDDYDTWLDDERDEMVKAYNAMRHWAMCGFLDAFLAALDADAILPEDFDY